MKRFSRLNATGVGVERYTHEAYGKTVIETVTGVPTGTVDHSTYHNPYMWTGQRYAAGAPQDIAGILSNARCPDCSPTRLHVHTEHAPAALDVRCRRVFA